MAGYRRRSPLRPFLAVAIFYGALLLAWTGRRLWIATVRIDTVRPSYHHYDFIEIRLRARDPALLKDWQAHPPRAFVSRDGRAVETIAGIEEVELRWSAPAGAFIGRWPCPWNAPSGEYLPQLVGRRELAPRLRTTPFGIRHRVPKRLPRKFAALTMETARPLATVRVKTPDGRVQGWRGLVDWVEFLGADAFWVLAGQTPGERPGQVWVSYNLPTVRLLAEECRRRRIQFGVYAMGYLTMSKHRLPRYVYAQDVEAGSSVFTRAISLRDPLRPTDLALFLKQFQDVPGVDFLGLDYMRNALGGYELAGEFLAEMPGVVPPPQWDRLDSKERMVWLARKKIMRRDRQFIEAWQWWRARRVALIVKQIKEVLGDAKPLWVFTLTWDKGWHHGQDPVMLNDAGVDVDALMLYEADSVQFDQMMKDWRSYVRSSDVQLMVGDVLDWPLHQNSPRGPAEFYDRTVRALGEIYRDSPAAGLFVHDLARGLWGRLGPYSTMDWMLAARAAIRHFRRMETPPAVGRADNGRGDAVVPPGSRRPLGHGRAIPSPAIFSGPEAGGGRGSRERTGSSNNGLPVPMDAR